MRAIFAFGLALVLTSAIPVGPASAHGSPDTGLPPVGPSVTAAASPFSFVDSSNGLSTMQWEGGPTEVKIVDWDLDGNPDILSVGDHGNPKINSAEDGLMRYLGDGQGGWSLKQGGGFGYGGLGIGDLNQDGTNDVVVGTHHNYPSSGCGNKLIDVCLGPDLQTWNTGMSTAGEDYGMFNSEVGDFDNDGWLDVASNTFGTPNAGAGTVIYRNNHDGTWTNSFKTPAGVSALTLAVADFDADGCLDMISPNDGGTLFRGDCKGSQTRTESGLPVFDNGVGPRGASFGDLDNDGILELAFTQNFQGAGGYVYMPFLYRWDGSAWKNDSASIWPLFDLSDLNSTWAFTQMGDADMDGNIDMLVAGRPGFTVLRGGGTGKFTRDYTYNFTDPDARGWTAFRFGADADHNGYPDVAGVVSIQGSSYKYHSEPHFFKNLATGG
ncbi:MAG TPA: FG-GAP-like repeat-containing protein, partial [Thermoplasmata archaeon]|nr:FG-GAP-like repeat-containing protein [Thermoplasmata archaeon]